MSDAEFGFPNVRFECAREATSTTDMRRLTAAKRRRWVPPIGAMDFNGLWRQYQDGQGHLK
jgi:hypothetical protein